MFDDIGSKIKGLAIGVFALGAIGACILGLILISGDVVLFGVLVIAAGIAIAYVGSFRLYGYGQLIENSDTIVQLLKEAKEREKLSPSRSTSPSPVTASKPSVTSPGKPMDGLKPGEGETIVRCGKCGKDYIAPAGKSATCPYCGSTIMYYF